MDNGAVPKFIQLLSSANDDVREQVFFSSHSLAFHFFSFLVETEGLYICQKITSCKLILSFCW